MYSCIYSLSIVTRRAVLFRNLFVQKLVGFSALSPVGGLRANCFSLSRRCLFEFAGEMRRGFSMHGSLSPSCRLLALSSPRILAMRLEYLNSDICESIAAHLSTSDLASVSLTSKPVRSLIHPLLYSHYRVGYLNRFSLDARQRNNVKRYLRKLGGDETRCKLVKKITAFNDWIWGGPLEVELLLRVVEKAESLEEFRFERVRSCPLFQRSSLCDTDPFLWCRLLQVKT